MTTSGGRDEVANARSRKRGGDTRKERVTFCALRDAVPRKQVEQILLDELGERDQP